MAEAADDLKVLMPGQELVHGCGLTGDSDPSSYLIRLAEDVESSDLGSAAVGGKQGGEDADGGGLAGAVAAKECADAAGTDLKADVHECMGLAERTGET